MRAVLVLLLLAGALAPVAAASEPAPGVYMLDEDFAGPNGNAAAAAATHVRVSFTPKGGTRALSRTRTLTVKRKR